MLITLCNVSYMNFYEVISVTTTKTLSRHSKFIGSEANCFPRQVNPRFLDPSLARFVLKIMGIWMDGQTYRWTYG